MEESIIFDGSKSTTTHNRVGPLLPAYGRKKISTPLLKSLELQPVAQHSVQRQRIN